MGGEVTKTQTTNTTLNGYVGANASYNNLGTVLNKSVNLLGADVNGGLQLKTQTDRGTYFLNGEVGIGTHTRGKVSTGYEFDFKKDMGLELSATAEGTITNNNAVEVTNITELPITQKVTTEDGTTITLHNPERYIHSMKAKGYQAKCGLGASFTYNPKWGSIKVGVEGGVRTTPEININPEYKDYVEAYENGEFIDQFVDAYGNSKTETPQSIPPIKLPFAFTATHKVKPYITPTVDAEVNIYKGLSAVANADIYGGNVGFRYTFGKNK